MKQSIVFVIVVLTFVILAAGCSRNAPNSVSDIQTAVPTAKSISSDIESRKSFKYTITTDITPYNQNDYKPGGILKILVAINSVDGQYPVHYDLDCEGDGEYEYKGLTGDQECLYEVNSGKHQIRISGEVPAMWLCKRRNADSKCDDNSDSVFCHFPVKPAEKEARIISIDDWGDMEWKSMAWFAANCIGFDSIPKDAPNLSQVTDMSGMFAYSSFNLPLEHWDVSNVKNMHGMFDDNQIFNQPLEKWDVSNVTDMGNMFFKAWAFVQPLEKWNVSNVTNMHAMFYESGYNQPLEKWNVSNVTDMGYMFYYSNFNQPLDKWDVSNVTNMKAMFGGSPFNQPINHWNVSKVTNMSEMFMGHHRVGSNFNQPLDKWDVSNVTDMSMMFCDTPFNQPLENWNVSDVKKMEGMFMNASSFNQPLEKWNVSNVTDMNMMFTGASSFNQPLDKWDTSNVENMESMFESASSFAHYPSSWVVPEGASNNMFAGTKVEKEAKEKPLNTRKARKE